ncbi:hypothetical protein O0I10_004881 [Lichtheimia ornata]|uniref:Ribosomal protein L1 n=1 Tax=Lichtheimia ornata TaxID=688661 RepID=A0AAD7V8H1_9FUNG|nr:uncharacterized protein O0I10_004881 [Lichtheimia ornata]KAJ8659516.1 hypothetical protein O0I10_004881 [Lichtheimia ornata]
MTQTFDYNKKQAKAAVHALYDHHKSRESGDLLADEEPPLYVQIVTKEMFVPKRQSAGGKKIKAKHALYPSDTSICVFVKSDAEDIQKELANGGFKNLQVIDKSTLEGSYSTFEARRRLANAHDCFFVDDRIVSFMPKLLGKPFLEKVNKTPMPVNVASSAKINQMNTALRVQSYRPKGGVINLLRVGHLGLSEKEMLENLDAIVKEYLRVSNTKSEAIQELSLKLAKSPALPFYNSLP